LPALVITQTDSIHQQIEKLLADLRRARRNRPLGAAVGEEAARAAATPRLKVYHIGFDVNGQPEVSMERLVEMITQLVEPGTWDKEFYINGIGNKLVVRHTAAVQRQVQRLLTRELRLQLVPDDHEPAAALGGFH
jgi:hypothetical protein